MRSSLLPSALSVAELPEETDMAQLPFPDEEALEDAVEAAAEGCWSGLRKGLEGWTLLWCAVVWCCVVELNVDCVV
jgi:hypothetical protein